MSLFSPFYIAGTLAVWWLVGGIRGAASWWCPAAARKFGELPHANLVNCP
jgi:hypothetical protein